MRVASILLAIGFTLASVAVARADSSPPDVSVAPQYDSTHVYVPREDVDRFVECFLAAFGGRSSKQVVATVTPTPSRTTSQLLQTPYGTVSLFGFETPIPYPFGAERTGWLVTDIDVAVEAARTAGADVIVTTFTDPIGKDALIQWPGGIDMQLYWHFTKPSYPPLETVPENRVYLSVDSADAFLRDFLAFSRGRIVADDRSAPGTEIGRPNETYRRIRVESGFGKMTVLVTDGHLPYPYGRETTGYQAPRLDETIAKAKAAGAAVLVGPYVSQGREAVMMQFPGGWVAEIHALVGE